MNGIRAHNTDFVPFIIIHPHPQASDTPLKDSTETHYKQLLRASYAQFLLTSSLVYFYPGIPIPSPWNSIQFYSIYFTT